MVDDVDAYAQYETHNNLISISANRASLIETSECARNKVYEMKCVCITMYED